MRLLTFASPLSDLKGQTTPKSDSQAITSCTPDAGRCGSGAGFDDRGEHGPRGSLGVHVRPKALLIIGHSETLESDVGMRAGLAGGDIDLPPRLGVCRRDPERGVALL